MSEPRDEALSMLEAARVSRGLTQADLSDLSGIAQGVISKLEVGRIPLSADRRITLADRLDVPAELFDEPAMKPRLLHPLPHDAPVKAVNRLLADFALLHTWVPMLLSSTAPTPHRYRRNETAGRGRQIGARWSEIWNRDGEPVGDIVKLVEEAGVVCVKWDLSGVRSDVVGSWTNHGRPILLMNDTTERLKLRFAVAHEFGHGMLHGAPERGLEKDADDFAVEFLMPPGRLAEELRGASADRLVQLEGIWGVSANHLAGRARAEGMINEGRYRALLRDVKSAPRPPRGTPATGEHSLIENAILSRLQDGERPDEIARASLMSRRDLDRLYLTF